MGEGNEVNLCVLKCSTESVFIQFTEMGNVFLRDIFGPKNIYYNLS
jgi:hypothetical protein